MDGWGMREAITALSWRAKQATEGRGGMARLLFNVMTHTAGMNEPDATRPRLPTDIMPCLITAPSH